MKLFVRWTFFFLLLCANLPLLNGQQHRLPFRPVDAEYSEALDRIIMIAADPSRLLIYDPATRETNAVDLPQVPVALSVSPSGLFAAVGAGRNVISINLTERRIVRTYDALSSGTVREVVLADGFAYATSADGKAVSIRLSDGTQTFCNSCPTGGLGILHPTASAIYFQSYSSNGTFVGRLSGGTLNSVESVTLGESQCAVTGLAADSELVYASCGDVFRASPASSPSLRPVGRFLPAHTVIREHRTGRRIALAARVANSEEVQRVVLLEAGSYRTTGTVYPSRFRVATGNFPAVVRYIFFNRPGNSLYVISSAASGANLVNDFAVDAVRLDTLETCPAAFDALPSFQEDASWQGGKFTVNVRSSGSCLYNASATDWVVLDGGSTGAGEGALSYIVRTNATQSARVGEIRIGSERVTIRQSPRPDSPGATPLPFSIVAIDGPQQGSRVAFITENPNELHFFAPETGEDRVFPLPFRAAALAVRSDAAFAAVRMPGTIAYIDLRSGATVRQIPMPGQVTSLAIGSNQYLYACVDSRIVSVNLETGAATTSEGGGCSRQLRVHPSGTSLYSDGWGRWDIRQGPASAQGPQRYLSGPFWLSGSRLFDQNGSVLRTSESPADDLQGLGRLPVGSLRGIAMSPTRRVIVAISNDRAHIHDDESLAALSSRQLAAPGGTFWGAGRGFAIWNPSGEKAFVFSEWRNNGEVWMVDEIEHLGNECMITLDNTSLGFTASGGTAAISLTARAGCSWVPVASAPWISISPQGGVGSGSIQVTVPPNPGPSRSGVIQLGTLGQVTISQSAGSPISVQLSPSTLRVSALGGRSSVNVFGNSFGASVNAVPTVPWMTIASAGSSWFEVQVAANPGTARSGRVRVGVTELVVIQEGLADSALGLRFVPVAPCRVVDTRPDSGFTGIAGPPSLTAVRNVAIAGSCGVPPTAQAYSLNVTAVPRGPLAYLTIWPAGSSRPQVSTLNSMDGRIKANAAIVPAGNGAQISLFASDETDVVIDVNGYFVPSTLITALQFFPVTPCRVSDTRVAGGALGANQSRDFRIAEQCGVPVGAGAYALNITAVPSGPLSYLTAWPTGQPRPFVSTLNALAGGVVANAAIVPAGANGSVSLFATNPTHAVIDVTGYFAPAAFASGGLNFFPVSPCRAVDTRAQQALTGGPALIASQRREFPLANSACEIPPQARTLSLNTTVVPSGPLPFLTLWPGGAAQPGVSTLNSFDGSITSNAVLLPLGEARGISAFAPAGTHLILDINGYFAP
ncbi:MAG: BACON domain-containing protein [Bryobacterales bacterium]|nr:BACON domain-containing protein [Bryobacterales bacterium]